MKSFEDLQRTLSRIDGRSYRSYRELQGAWGQDGCTLFVDRVQADPFAAPSRLRLQVPAHEAALPTELWATRVRRRALGDFLARRVRDEIQGGGAPPARGSGRGGLLGIDAGGQEVLERSAVAIRAAGVEARFELGLPAAGRSVLGRQATHLLCEELPRIASAALLWRNLDAERARSFVECVENQEHIRVALDALGLVAFVADAAVLPRESGVSELPLSGEDVVPFLSPESLRVHLELPNPIGPPEARVRSISGMGVPRGVTLIVGGGHHGKSTLLRALERGVYAHVPGDGREYVVTHADAVKIRAEDGRSVRSVDISAFIADLPGGRSTRAFTSDDASGSTSQAASIVEALEGGARVLLLDEDTSATNFMIRDARMQALVAKEHEPITPFVDRVRDLYEREGVSSVLVMGGCGDYFEAADSVVMLQDYRVSDAGDEARHVAARWPTGRRAEATAPLAPRPARVPLAASLDASDGRRDVRLSVKARDQLLYGAQRLDLRGVEQIIDPSQTRAIGGALVLLARHHLDGRRSLAEAVDALEVLLDREGPDVLDPLRRGDEHPGNLARPRRHEIVAALSRLRSLRVQQAP